MIYVVYRTYENRPGIVDFMGEIEATDMDDAENQVENHFTLEPGEEFDIEAKNCRDEEIARLQEVIARKDAAINMLRESVRMAAENLKLAEEIMEDLKSLNEDMDIENDTLLLRRGNQKDEIVRLKEWKEEQLLVESSWDCQAVAKELNLPLGSDIRKQILPGIKDLNTKLEAANRTIEQMSQTYSADLAASAKVIAELGEKLEAAEAKLEKIKEITDDLITYIVAEADEYKLCHAAARHTRKRIGELMKSQQLGKNLAPLRAFVEKWSTKRLVCQGELVIQLRREADLIAEIHPHRIIADVIRRAAQVIQEYDQFASEAWTAICKVVEGK